MEYLEQIGIQAKEAEAVLRTLGSRDKDQALRKAAEYLVAAKAELLKANERDVAIAREKGMAQGPSGIERGQDSGDGGRAFTGSLC